MASGSDSTDFNTDDVETSATQPSSGRPPRMRKLRSKVWLDFERVRNDDGSIVAICRHCKKHLVGDSKSGTKHLSNHLNHCVDAQRLKRSGGVEGFAGEAETETPFIFNNERSRDDFAKMVIVHQYPFSIIEHEFFRRFVKNLQPDFTLLSRNTVKANCVKLYGKEKEMVYSELQGLTCRMSLTSDIWTSIGNKGYLCLTCHYIDDDWNLRKKILNFEYFEAPHGHREIKNMLLDKLLEWNIDKKLFSIVLDNASANNKAVQQLLSDPTFRKSLLLEGSMFHVRRSAHILNLIVQNGLKDIDDIIVKIRESVKYVKSSQSRKENFMKAVRREKGVQQKSLILDVQTRWNSTYLMLECAIEFESVFSCLHLYDSSYTYAPSTEDWEQVKLLVECLNVFYEVTERLSGSKYPTSNMFFGDICIIHVSLKQWCCHAEPFISSMAMKMLIKFEKYWKKMNVLLAIAAILDPRFKMIMVKYFYEKFFGDEAGEKIFEVQSGLQNLYNAYDVSGGNRSIQNDVPSESEDISALFMSALSKRRIGSSSRSTLSSMYMEFDQYLHQTSLIQTEKSDLQLYLEEAPKQEGDMNILKWWKDNSSRYPTLSLMARDILAIPMSTVAAESAFSTGSRVLNKYRSSLDHTTVEALICTESWLRGDPSLVDVLGENTLSTIFASCRITEEDEEQVLGVLDDESFVASSSSN